VGRHDARAEDTAQRGTRQTGGKRRRGLKAGTHPRARSRQDREGLTGEKKWHGSPPQSAPAPASGNTRGRASHRHDYRPSAKLAVKTPVQGLDVVERTRGEEKHPDGPATAATTPIHTCEWHSGLPPRAWRAHHDGKPGHGQPGPADARPRCSATRPGARVGQRKPASHGLCHRQRCTHEVTAPQGPSGQNRD
jgi:hypothetical protein